MTAVNDAEAFGRRARESTPRIHEAEIAALESELAVPQEQLDDYARRNSQR